jgi:histidinol dehydrogenase
MSLTAKPLRLSTASADFEMQFAQRLHWSADTDHAIEQRVADILAEVRARGDAAVLEYTARFDGLHAETMAGLELTQAELKAAFDGLPATQRSALEAAAARVRRYHEAQKKASGESWTYRDEDGSAAGPEGHAAGPCGHLRARRQGGLPFERADERRSRARGRRGRDHHGRAHTRGASAIRWCWPPRYRGRRHARLHASAAPRPWRLWPTARPLCRQGGQDHRPRQRLRGQQPRSACSATVGIDMIAGPSEILVHGRRQHAGRLGGDGPVQPGRARRAGPEHPAHARMPPTSTPCRRCDRPPAAGPCRAASIIAKSLERGPRGADPHLRDMEEACAISNCIAPEHLEVSSRRARHRWEPLLQARRCHLPRQPTPARAWATTAPAPTMCCPPAGTARFSSPLGVYDFVRSARSLIEVSAKPVPRCWVPIAAELAYGEGLQAHARAAEIAPE